MFQRNQFRKVLDFLKDFAEFYNIKIDWVEDSFFDEDIAGGYSVVDRTIRIKRESNTERLSYILAHELGHAIDADNMSSTELEQHVENIQLFNDTMVFQLDFVPGMKEFILETEKIAFWYAECILALAGKKLRKRYYKHIRASSLRSYMSIFNQDAF